MTLEQKKIITTLASMIETNREDVSKELIEALDLACALAFYIERETNSRKAGSIHTAQLIERHIDDTYRRLGALGITW